MTTPSQIDVSTLREGETKAAGVRRIPIAELHETLRSQGVSSRLHYAVKCVVCGTVQSIQSFIAAGVDDDSASREAGFSCIGRHTKAGPHKRKDRPGKGCDWTLGGLFTIHKLEVVTDDGKAHPCFEPASPEEAQTLEAAHAKAVAP